MTKVQSFIHGKKAKKHGITPSVALYNPKYDHNVAKSLRLCSCYGIKQLWYSGDRVQIDPTKGRLLREERMKGYKDVEIRQYDKFIDQFENVTPVAVEISPNAELLPFFDHPENALYIFGPEDGHIPGGISSKCHRFVAIPTHHCLNLATAVATVLWDRRLKRIQQGLEPVLTMAQMLNEWRPWIETDDALVNW